MSTVFLLTNIIKVIFFFEIISIWGNKVMSMTLLLRKSHLSTWLCLWLMSDIPESLIPIFWKLTVMSFHLIIYKDCQSLYIWFELAASNKFVCGLCQRTHTRARQPWAEQVHYAHLSIRRNLKLLYCSLCKHRNWNIFDDEKLSRFWSAAR